MDVGRMKVTTILDCLYETYDLEWDMLSRGRKFYDTIVLPFLIMLSKECRDMREREIHELLVKAFTDSEDKEDFRQKAMEAIAPYLQLEAVCAEEGSE
ncbi:MAG: hypothetical protein Q4C65_13415 [Eubacteriales bacterium]|nr:hypothetical protein [Eubacteriales bacterium]